MSSPQVRSNSAGSKAFTDSDPNRTKSETILLLHGTAGSAEASYWALAPMLMTRHRIIMFDFTDPARDEDRVTHQFYVDQAAAVLAAISTDGPVHVVGYSFGAVIAAKLAAQMQEAFASLTLIAGWLKTDSHQLLRNDVWRALNLEQSSALPSFLCYTTYSANFLNSRNDEELSTLLRSADAGPDRSSKMNLNRSVDLTNDVNEVRAPTLVIGCKFDQTAPIHHGRQLFGAIKNSRFAEITAGHGVVIERPAELFAMIDSFVKDPNRLPAGSILQNIHA